MFIESLILIPEQTTKIKHVGYLPESVVIGSKQHVTEVSERSTDAVPR